MTPGTWNLGTLSRRSPEAAWRLPDEGGSPARKASRRDAGGPTLPASGGGRTRGNEVQLFAAIRVDSQLV
jgi:hypothetical protein